MMHHPDYELVGKMDRKTLELIERLDTEALSTGWTEQRQNLCGLAPVLVLMKYALLKGCRKGTVLKYENSGDKNPSHRGRWVVGYGSVIFELP
jgi:AmmeMemoRadiSam system protein B